MPNFVYTPSKNKGDSIIEPINKGDYKGNIIHVTVYRGGDAIFYKTKKGNSTRFDIAPDAIFWSLKHGLPSNDRLRGLDDRNLQKLSAITGISLDDLVEIRSLEVEHNAPKPYHKAPKQYIIRRDI